jgi:hypothetical protein
MRWPFVASCPVLSSRDSKNGRAFQQQFDIEYSRAVQTAAHETHSSLGWFCVACKNIFQFVVNYVNFIGKKVVLGRRNLPLSFDTTPIAKENKIFRRTNTHRQENRQ